MVVSVQTGIHVMNKIRGLWCQLYSMLRGYQLVMECALSRRKFGADVTAVFLASEVPHVTLYISVT